MKIKSNGARIKRNHGWSAQHQSRARQQAALAESAMAANQVRFTVGEARLLQEIRRQLDEKARASTSLPEIRSILTILARLKGVGSAVFISLTPEAGE